MVLHILLLGTVAASTRECSFASTKATSPHGKAMLQKLAGFKSRVRTVGVRRKWDDGDSLAAGVSGDRTQCIFEEKDGAANAPLNETGFDATRSLCCQPVMAQFIRRLIQADGREVCNEGSLNGLASYYDCPTDTRNFAYLQSEIGPGSAARDGPCAWIKEGYAFAGKDNWRLVHVKQSCLFNPVQSSVVDCAQHSLQNCASAVSGSWDEGIWVFGGDSSSPWVKFKRDSSHSSSIKLASFLERGSNQLTYQTIPGFSSSSVHNLGTMTLNAGTNYISQIASSSADLRLGTGDFEKCVAGVCRTCQSNPVWFLVRNLRTTTTNYTCGTSISNDCQSEHSSAVNNGSLSQFCTRCATEGGPNPLRTRCILCCDECPLPTTTAATTIHAHSCPTMQSTCPHFPGAGGGSTTTVIAPPPPPPSPGSTAQPPPSPGPPSNGQSSTTAPCM